MFDTYEKIFSQRAHSYHKAMADCPQARDAEFEMMVEPLGTVGHVIDMPAGGGYLRRYLPAHVHYTAVEPAPQFFEACPQDALAMRVMSPIETVPLPDAAADALLCLAGLHHAPDLDVVFSEMHRLLRADATLVIADVAADSAPDTFLNEYVHAHSAMGHTGTFLDENTVLRLERAGFALVQDRQLVTPWRFASRAAAGRFCADMFGIDGKGPAQVAEALADIIGFEAAATEVVLNWSLRRIVCLRVK
jgi:SAM-dependent methyltransferase